MAFTSTNSSQLQANAIGLKSRDAPESVSLLQLSDLTGYFDEITGFGGSSGLQMAQATNQNQGGGRNLLSKMQKGAETQLAQASVEDSLQGAIELSAGNVTMVMCGMVVLLIALPMICLNERRFAKIWHVLARAKDEVVPRINIHKATNRHNFKLVHCSGKCNTDKAVRDERFAVSVDQTIRLTRRVEMLQWVEIKKEEQSSEGNKTWYEYRQEWRTNQIDYHLFDQQVGHENPRAMACKAETFRCDQAYLGEFILNMSQIARLSKSKDFRPNDEQRDEIERHSAEWLNEIGFSELQYKTQYFETSPRGESAKGLAPGIGSTRISWVYVPCSKMTVLAQQMQIENERLQSEYTFRKWNPGHERVMWGSDNDSSLEPICPMTFLCCFVTEVICFKLIFKETIDHCAAGYKSVQQIIGEYHRSQSILGRTNAMRFVIFILVVGGCYLTIAPFAATLLWIPEVGYLLSNQFIMSALIFAVHCAAVLYFTIVALAWIPYRCLLSFFLLAIAGSLVGLMALGKPLSSNAALEIYK